MRDLQERLEQVLKDKFEKVWRPRDVIRWNRNNMQIFRRQIFVGKQIGKYYAAKTADCVRHKVAKLICLRCQFAAELPLKWARRGASDQ